MAFWHKWRGQRSWGFLALGAWLILHGLSECGVFLEVLNKGLISGLLAIAAGILILLGK